jgi:hypothetical protein
VIRFKTRLISAAVSGISPGSPGGRSSGEAGGRGSVLVRSRANADFHAAGSAQGQLNS